jgi:hypothetical protein
MKWRYVDRVREKAEMAIVSRWVRSTLVEPEV